MKTLNVLLLLALALPASAAGRADFFLCDHDHTEKFSDELRHFIAAHDVLLLDYAPPGGREQGLQMRKLMQAMSDGEVPPEPERLFPADWLRTTTDKSVGLTISVAQDVYKTHKVIVPEASIWPAKTSPVIAGLWARREALYQKAREKFSRGDFKGAVADWRSGKTADARRLDLRDEAMVDALMAMHRRYPDRAIGAILGAFHTWPYLQVKKALELPKGGFHVDREYHPAGAYSDRPYTHVPPETYSDLDVARLIVRQLLETAVAPDAPADRAEAAVARMPAALTQADADNLSAAFKAAAPKPGPDAGAFAAAWMRRNFALAFPTNGVFRPSEDAPELKSLQ